MTRLKATAGASTDSTLDKESDSFELAQHFDPNGLE